MKRWALGDQGRSYMVITPTSNEIFGAMSGDKNPVHFDEKRIQKTRYKAPIANGIQCISCIGSAIVDLFCTDTTMVIALEQHNSFIKPVYVGEAIDAECTIDEIQDNNTYWCQCFVKNREEEICIAARFRVRVLEA